MLPLVRAIVADLSELARDVAERRRRISFLLAGRNPNDHDVYHEELVQMEQEMEKDTRRLHEYREELRALGIESENGPKDMWISHLFWTDTKYRFAGNSANPRCFSGTIATPYARRVTF